MADDLHCFCGSFAPVRLQRRYRHADGVYPTHGSVIESGEFRHGPLEIVEPGIPFLFLLGNDESRHTTERAISFVKQRTDNVIVIDYADIAQGLHPRLAPFLMFVPMEWLCYYLSIYKITTRMNAATTAALWNINPLTGPAKAGFPKGNMMKTGMFTCGHQRLPVEHAFRDARELGYDGIELWGGRPHAFAPDLKAGGIRQIKALAETYQLPIIGYTPETNGYPYNMMIGDERMRRESPT